MEGNHLLEFFFWETEKQRNGMELNKGEEQKEADETYMYLDKAPAAYKPDTSKSTW